MIRLPATLQEAIRRHGESAYPEECCGLLIGDRGSTNKKQGGASNVRVTDAVRCRNVADAPERTFEIDPQARIDTERRLRGTPQRIVGHYHSHPDGPARPSARDRERAFETDHVWVIVAVESGKASRPHAFVLDDRGAFGEIGLDET